MMNTKTIVGVTAPLSKLPLLQERAGVRLGVGGEANMLSTHGMLELDCSKWQAGMYLMELVGDKIKLGTTNVVVVHNK